MDAQFWKDGQNNTRDNNFNVFFRLKRESWGNAHGLVDGEWSWFIYNRLPRNVSTGALQRSPAGIHYNIDLTPNVARIGMLHPPADGFLDKKPQLASWFSWEGYHELASHDLPYMESSTSRRLLEVDIHVGSQARTLNVTYPTLVEALIDFGASYEFAKGVGITFAFAVWLICQCNLVGGIQALCNASQGQFAGSDSETAPSEDRKNREEEPQGELRGGAAVTPETSQSEDRKRS
jgi:hypothetical protein